MNCCCQRQPPACPRESLCPLMHRIQLMSQMLLRAFRFEPSHTPDVAELELLSLNLWPPERGQQAPEFLLRAPLRKPQ
ncbi:hypothetical protein SKAU_G00207040 [Synaphobranchus kaupii]|uniref:Uncharacterized protein n=1 Tax=Synaphobranchus kaupii TaxID=118154 RepID=A0A9Q1F8D4_SYNKA|nr:hypothetical protein SKAU_G00207040 [Synaphobranchus kaupii]